MLVFLVVQQVAAEGDEIVRPQLFVDAVRRAI
jgi:hypothetical protein